MNICTYECIIAKSLVNILEFILMLPLKSTLRIQNSPLAIRDGLAVEELDYAFVFSIYKVELSCKINTPKIIAGSIIFKFNFSSVCVKTK